MEASVRFPINGFHDLERLITALGACHELVPGSLRLTEGTERLARQLDGECRQDVILRVEHAQTPGGLIGLFRCLWIHPLATPCPQSLRLEAKLKTSPADRICMFLDAPAVGAMPRGVEARLGRNPAARERLLEVYRSIARAAGLTFEQV